MRAWEAVISWNPTTKEVLVLSRREYLPNWRAISDKYPYDVGANFADRSKARGVVSLLFLFLDFHTLVARDLMPVDAVHREFMKIRDYREHISPDTPEKISLDTGEDEA